jgi:hypothetical protein
VTASITIPAGGSHRVLVIGTSIAMGTGSPSSVFTAGYDIDSASATTMSRTTLYQADLTTLTFSAVVTLSSGSHTVGLLAGVGSAPDSIESHGGSLVVVDLGPA